MKNIVFSVIILLTLIAGVTGCDLLNEEATPTPSPALSPTPTYETELLLEADLSQIDDNEVEEVMGNVINITESRIEAYDVTDFIVQQQGNDSIYVQFYGTTNVEGLTELLVTIGKLYFRELTDDGWKQYKNSSYTNPVEPNTLEWIPAEGTLNGKKVHLTSEYLLDNTYVEFNQTTGEPRVSFEFNSDGAKLMVEITGRLFIGTLIDDNRPLGIFLDNKLISSPTVQAVISDGGVITGITVEEAKELVILLNADVLPVPLELVSVQSTVPSPTPIPTLTPMPTSEPTIYSNYTVEGLFSISYPQGWTLDTTIDYEQVLFYSGIPRGDEYRIRVILMEQPLPRNYETVEEVVTGYNFTDELARPEYKVLSQVKTVIDGSEAMIVEYTDDGIDISASSGCRYIRMSTIRDKSVWSIDCGAPIEDFEYYEDTFYNVINSLRVLYSDANYPNLTLP